MASSVNFGDIVANLSGSLPAEGKTAPDFSLVAADLSERTLADYAGKAVVLSIFPSIDTPTCATAVRTFNERAAAAGKPVLCISKDLPFASKRFCAAEGIESVECLSAFRSADFGREYGVEIVDSPLKGLLARAVVVLDGSGKVVHSQLVGDIKNEPDYSPALEALEQA